MYHLDLIRNLKDEAATRLERRQFRSAVDCLRRLCVLQPNDGMQRVRLGHALMRLGRSREALGVFREAVNAFLRSYDYAQALAATRLVLELDPTNEGAHQLRREMADRSLTGTAKVSVLAVLAQQRQEGSSRPLSVSL